MKRDLILGAVLALGAVAGGPHKTYFTGEISDSQCAAKVHSRTGSHSEMLKLDGYGPTAADCARVCIRQYGGRFVLVQPEKGLVYRLEPQDRLERFGGQRVTFEGSLNLKTKSIHVAGIKLVQKQLKLVGVPIRETGPADGYAGPFPGG